MHKAQEQVTAFHAALDVTIGEQPAIRDADLRASLIAEEATETIDAIRAGDIVAAIDGLCDLLYVAYGTAVSFGIDLEPFFEEVHASNMAKLGAGRRADGKVLKSVEWQPPRIAEILESQASRGPQRTPVRFHDRARMDRSDHLR
jgi:predicted HAD superfamily Cof-like phosphohydrolase